MKETHVIFTSVNGLGAGAEAAVVVAAGPPQGQCRNNIERET